MPEGGGAQIVAGFISGLSFQYFDAAGNRTAAGSEVRRIGVTISGASLRPDPRTGKIFGVRVNARYRYPPDTYLMGSHDDDKGNLNHSFRKERNRGVFMKKFAMLLHAVFLIAFISAANAQSLADLAKQEKERREGVKATASSPKRKRPNTRENRTPPARCREQPSDARPGGQEE